MNLSRTESRGRLRDIPLGRWIVAVLLLIAAVVAAFVLYVRAADSEYRNGKRQAAALAAEQGELTEIERVTSYTWEETLWIVQGKDAGGETWMLWERGDGFVKRKLSESRSEAQMLAQFGLQLPDAEPIRIQPGWFGNAPVWEIRYRQSPDSERQSIGFYSFEEGTLIRTYDLPGG